MGEQQSMFCQAKGEWRRCAEKHRRPRYQCWPQWDGVCVRARVCACVKVYVRVCVTVRACVYGICYNHTKATSRYHRHHNHHRHSVDDIVARLWHGPFVMSYDNSNSSSRRCIVLRYRCWRARGYSRQPGVRSRRHSRRSHRTARVAAAVVPRPRPTVVFLCRCPSEPVRHLSAGSLACLSADRAFGVPYFDDTAVSSPDATTEVPTTKPHKDDGPAAQQTPSGTPQIADVGGGGGSGPVRSDTAEKPLRHPLTAVRDFVLRPTHSIVGSCFTRKRIFSIYIYTGKPNFFFLFVFWTRSTVSNPNLR